MKIIEFYTTQDGKCPFIELRNSLSIEFQVRVAKRLKRLQEGNYGDWKRLKNSKLSELRLDFGKGYRIYFKELDNVIILILAGSDKSNQNEIIKQSNKYFEDYLYRSNKNDNQI